MNARAICLAIASLAALVAPSRAETDKQAFEVVEHGRYLATVGDCVACHTAPDGKPFAGGLRIDTPFGPLVSPNLTPDRDTGIGAWTDEQFFQAMHDGIGEHGQKLYPAFPYTSFTRASREDVMAIRAYLATLQPVRNEVTSNTLPFPFNIRATMYAWNWLFLKPGYYKPDPRQSAEWNRGAYLVEGLGHCDACHTPRNFLGGENYNQSFKGAITQGWFAPDLADDRGGLVEWSIDDVVAYLETGHNRQAAATGPMADVIVHSTSRMTRADLRAMAVYLKSLPGEAPASGSSPIPDLQMKAGANIYQASCAACHGMNGDGVPRMFPALAKAPDVQSVDPRNVLRVILEGAKSVVTDSNPTGAAMPTYAWKLTDDQIAAVATYVRNSWSNAATAVSASDVASLRKKLASGDND